jgi:hypothetical protein
MNAWSTDPNRSYDFGSISTDRIQDQSGTASGALLLNRTAVWYNAATMLCNRFAPVSASTVTLDSVPIVDGAYAVGDNVTITGKLAAAPTFEATDTIMAAFWISDGTLAGSANGDIMLTTWDGTTSTTKCVKAFTPYYQAIEPTTDGVTAADGSEATVGLELTAVSDGTYMMSYTMTIRPNTDWESREWIVWVAGSASGVLLDSIKAILPLAAEQSVHCIHHSWVQTLTQTETLTMSSKFSATGTHTVTIDATYPMRFSAVRIA